MHASLLLVPALSASVLAAPAYPELNVNAVQPGGVQCVSDYFNLIAQKVQASRWMSTAPVCDLSQAQLSQDTPTALPPPGAGLTLKHVAIGRGTQNYTCDTTNATAVPVQIGALATLFNASCVAATYPDLLNMLPRVALQFNLTDSETATLAPSNLAISGHHFFTTTTTPFFNLNTSAMQLGEAACSKNASEPAPADAPKGQQGENAVAWLKLITKVGATGDLQEVYRVQTAGGSPPATCAGMPAAFTVQYAAQYWFYESSGTPSKA